MMWGNGKLGYATTEDSASDCITIDKKNRVEPTPPNVIPEKPSQYFKEEQIKYISSVIDDNFNKQIKINELEYEIDGYKTQIKDMEEATACHVEFIVSQDREMIEKSKMISEMWEIIKKHN